MNNKKIQEIGKNVIQFEIDALKNLKKHIGINFNKILKIILNCKEGKVIISGVGKSGIIGKKWAATLSSTGTPAFFLDASSASHGDMGQITSKDVVILISNSGESDELKNIIQYTSRNRNIKLIGITSKKNSILFKNSDVPFLTPAIKEAGPENIVPTSSTTTQLALGDAIAVALLKVKGFTSEDFAKSHPGGKLGKKLTLRTKDLMVPINKAAVVKDSDSIKDLIFEVSEKKQGIALIKKGSRVIGVFSDGDLRRQLQKNVEIDKVRLSSVLTKKFKRIKSNELVVKAAELMKAYKVYTLVVEENKKVVGILTMHDILEANVL